MRLSLDQRLSKSGLYIPKKILDNEKAYSRKNRIVWTPDGEVSVPMKKKRVARGMTGSVRDIWMKDERGRLILFDPVGEANTISDGALYDILQMMMGYWSNNSGIQFDDSAAGNNGPGTSGPWYNDGAYDYPNINDLNSAYNGTDTIYAYASFTQLSFSLFGNLWFINGVAGGMTGSYIPSASLGAGFVPNVSVNNYYMNGWFSVEPTSSLSANTTISDSLSNATWGTPQIQHTLTFSLSSTGTSFTFDGIAWLPQSAYIRQYFGNTGGSYYAAGNTPTTFVDSYGSYPEVTLEWASASTTPTTIDDLMAAALWVPGYAITLNPGGSWGFTYAFQM